MESDSKKGYFYAFGAVLIWSGFILVSRQGGISPLLPYDVIAIRYFTCSLLVLPLWLFWKRFNILQTRLIVSALIGGLSYAMFAFKGFQLTPASHAAILLPGLLPLVIALLTAVINKERHANSKYLGVSLITVGIGILFWQEFEKNNSLSIGHLSLMGAAVCWAVFSVLINRWNITPWEATVSLAVVTSVVYLPVYMLWLPKAISVELWQDIIVQSFYQGFMATIIQMMLYVRAIQLIGASHMGSMMAIVPILAGFSAIPIFGEPLKSEIVIALFLVSLGVWVANSTWFKTLLVLPGQTQSL